MAAGRLEVAEPQDLTQELLVVGGAERVLDRRLQERAHERHPLVGRGAVASGLPASSTGRDSARSASRTASASKGSGAGSTPAGSSCRRRRSRGGVSPSSP